MQALLDALRQIAEVMLAFFTGELQGKLKAQNEQAQADLRASQEASKADAVYPTLSDDELRRDTLARAERLRLRTKARAADGGRSGGDE